MPTWKGWLLIVLLFAAITAGVLHSAALFLSPNKPVGAQVLLMEGWLSDSGIEYTVGLTSTNHYALVLVAGQGIERGKDISHYGTYAELGAARLVALGFKGTNLIKVPAPRTKRDRTYHTALYVRDYILTNTPYRSLDLVSESAHARRSWLLYRKACEPGIKVGVIATENPEFDTRNWWKSSNGVRIVLNEAIGYLYAKLVFNPE